MPEYTYFQLEPPYRQRRIILQRGTHAMGANSGAGTVSFGTRFAGTPFVALQAVAGSSSFGRTIHLTVTSRFSGSFNYRGSPAHGTFDWMAVGDVI